VQTVSWDDNRFFYEILAEFKAITGVPVLLNTSMNGNGEPLVESPQDALRFFHDGRIDAMVVNDRLLLRGNTVPS
jgi:carbamoyltransferase